MAIQKADTRMTATELMKPKGKRKDKLREFWRRMQKAIRRLREREHEITNEPTKERESHVR